MCTDVKFFEAGNRALLLKIKNLTDATHTIGIPARAQNVKNCGIGGCSVSVVGSLRCFLNVSGGVCDLDMLGLAFCGSVGLIFCGLFEFVGVFFVLLLGAVWVLLLGLLSRCVWVRWICVGLFVSIVCPSRCLRLHLFCFGVGFSGQL